MKEKQDYIQDIAEIRSMMEKSSKFLSLSGWAGIMAGVYALSGACIAYLVFSFYPNEIAYSNIETAFPNLLEVIFLAIVILFLAMATAIILSSKRADKRGEKLWNTTARQLLIHMAIPLVAGGLLALIFIAKGLIGLLIPCTLLFYGLALYNAGKFTYSEIKMLGLIQIGLGLTSAYFVEYGLVLWALGFGVIHIIYGIYMHCKYER
jgi:hypothetical protein